MSIHQAKGLEFPIVVVPDLNRTSNIPRAGVAFDRELGPLVRPAKGAGDADPDAGGSGAGQSLGWTIHQTLERAEDEAEALRLFYVATTRARDMLILSAGVGPGAKPVSPAMRLLDARFDRRTGACRVPLLQGWPEPSVRVTTVEPRPLSGSRPASKRRPALAAVARVITSTPVQSAMPRPAALTRARLIDLDAIRGLSPYEARLDRLVRSVLKDPAALRRGGLPDAARRAARRQSPRAHSTLVGEAVKRLQPWISGRVGELIAGAVKVERGSGWSVSWPIGSPSATVFQGWTDALVCDGRGVWSVILFSPPGASQAWEHLRWVLAARVAHAREVGTVGSGWRVVLGEGGGLRGGDAFDAAAVEAALRAAWGDDRLSE
jgi:ATP-dependent helicase/nuclease subunit A